MKLLDSRFLLIAALAALSACGRQSTPSSTADAGERYFKGYGCIKCHQIGDEGGTWAPNLTFVGFRKSPEWLRLWLKNPHAWRPETVMPNFHLPDDVRESLVAYLSQQKGQAWDKDGRPWNRPEAMGDPVHRGEVLFNMAGCVACHAQGGRGGYPNNNVVGNQIPSLTKVVEGYTKEELMNKIRNGVISSPADPSAPAPMVFMPKWGDVLKDEELDAVASYLLTLGPKTSKSSEGW